MKEIDFTAPDHNNTHNFTGNAVMSVDLDSIKVQITGRNFSTQTKFAKSKSSPNDLADLTITGTFSADRKMIDELTMTYSFSNKTTTKNDIKWNFTARNIPFIFEWKKIDYELIADNPAERPANFSIPKGEYLKTLYSETPGLYGGTDRYSFQQDGFNAAAAGVRIELSFYVSPTMPLVKPPK